MAKSLLHVITAAAAFAGIAGIIAPTSAKPPPYHEVPFNVDVDGERIVDTIAFPFLYAHGSGDVHGSFGLREYEFSNQVDISTFPASNVVGSSVYTAANGDELYTNQVFEVVIFNPDGSVTLDLTEQFDGGTGKFEGAMGEIHLVGSAEITGPDTNTFALHSEGTILLKHRHNHGHGDCDDD